MSIVDDSPNVTPMCDKISLVAKCLKLFSVAIIAPAPMENEGGYLDMLALLQPWYRIARYHSSSANNQRNGIKSFFDTLMRTLGSHRVEEQTGKVYSAGLGW